MSKASHWIHQERKCAVPWVLFVECEKIRRRYDWRVTVFSEFIPDESKRLVIENVRSIDSAISSVKEILRSIGHDFSESDEEQLEREFDDFVKEHFK